MSPIPLYAFTTHKSGTVLFEHIMQHVAAHFGDAPGRRAVTRYGMVIQPPTEADIVIFAHSLIGYDITARPFRGVRVVRDPRDIWVSSYLYHLRCNESWCTNEDVTERFPVAFPQVDFSFLHRRERWKRDYLKRLEGRSYQHNLQQRDRTTGLAFELDNYTGCTLEAMEAWTLQSPMLLQIKLEDVVADFNASLLTVLRHFGLTDAACEDVLRRAAGENMAAMDDAAIAANPHIQSRQLSKWRDILTAEQIAAFERRHGALITRLGYALSNQGS